MRNERLALSVFFLFSLAVMSVFSLSAGLAAQEAEFTVAGVVVDGSSGVAISGATVDLEGVGERTSGPNGSFRYEGIPAGRYMLRVRVIGYHVVERVLDVRADTELRIEADVQPIPLDTLNARSWNVSIDGRVSDEETRRPIPDAEVLLDLEPRSSTGVAGRFRIRNVPASAPVSVEVRAFGYMPAHVIVASEDDVTLNFNLPVDPIVQAMIAHEIARLEERARAQPARAVRIDREALMNRSRWSAWDVIEPRLPIRGGISCLILDEREIPPTVGLEEYLRGYSAAAIEHIEILTLRSLGRLVMVRVYTREFMREMVGGAADLRPITLVSVPGRPLCR